MPDRLTKIVTRGGDKGETSLGDGTRIPKDDARISLLGDVDELNSWIGVILSHDPGETVHETLTGVQHDLFDLGGALCFPGAPLLTERHVARLDEASVELNETLPPLKEFILPGGAPLISFLHIGRTVCRRVERAMASFLREEPEAQRALQYLNRLSDYLFIVARAEARRLGVQETLWKKESSLSS